MARYVREKLKDPHEEMSEFTLIHGCFNIPLSIIDRSNKDKINKNVVQQNSPINQLDQIDIYRLFHPTKAENTVFPNSPVTFAICITHSKT